MIYASLDSPALSELREHVCDALEAVGLELAEDHGFHAPYHPHDGGVGHAQPNGSLRRGRYASTRLACGLVLSI